MGFSFLVTALLLAQPSAPPSAAPKQGPVVLFLVDNSASMEAMSMELNSRFNQFVGVFKTLAYVALAILAVAALYFLFTERERKKPEPG